MRAMICDDEKSTCAELEQILINYSSERGVRLEVDVFFSGDSMISYLQEKEAPDILFLDIELPGANGVVVGDYIRSVLENEQVYIIYISSKKQYALQLFQNRPFDFLIKPLEKEKIFHVLDKIYRLAGKSNHCFEYQNKGNVFRISYGDILYFQSVDRKIHIVTKKETRSFYGKLADIRKKLPESLFLSIHKSYLINYNYVKEYTYEWVKMVNGDILNISKVNRAVVRRKILERETDEFRNQ